MANYYSASRTNYFRVTDEVKYAALIERLTVGEGELYDFTKTDENGVIWHGFGAYDTIDYLNPAYDEFGDDEDEFDEDAFDEEDYEDYDLDAFLKELATILPDGEAFILFNAGHEKLRYISGSAIIVTNKGIDSVGLEEMAVAKAADLLGVSIFSTRCTY